MADSFNGSNATAEQIHDQTISAIDSALSSASLAPVTYSPASGFPASSGGYGAVTFNAPVSGVVQLPANYILAYVDTPGPTTLTAAGVTGQSATAYSGGLDYDGNGATSNVYTASSAAVSGDFIDVRGSSGNYVAAGEGNDTVVADTGNNSIATGAGRNLVYVTSGDNLIGSEGSDTIVAGTGADTVDVSGNVLAFGGSGNLQFLNGAGQSTVVGGTGNISVYGGTGGGVFFGGSGGNNLLEAGATSSALIAGGDGDQLYAGSAAGDVLVASTGNETLSGAGTTGSNSYFGGSGAAQVFMGAGSDEYVGGSGSDTISFGSGYDTAFSGTGADVYQVVSGQAGGVDQIVGFKSGVDQVSLVSFGSTGVADAFASAQISGNNTVVRLDDGTDLVFVGVRQLAQNTFV